MELNVCVSCTGAGLQFNYLMYSDNKDQSAYAWLVGLQGSLVLVELP